MKKILALAFLAVILSSCSGKIKKDQIDSENQKAIENQVEVPQDTEDFDVIDNEAVAEEINQEAQAEIEEIEVSDRVFFDLNASSISDDAKEILDNQVAWLKSDPNIKVVVEGHCDERGAREYNIALGEKRANSVKQYLTANGVDSSRIKTLSYGKERPAFVGIGEIIWGKNRRAVTTIEE